MVRSQKHEIYPIYMQCRDADEVTSREESCTILKKNSSCNNLEKIFIVNLRKAYSGIQTATLGLRVAAVQKLLAVGKLVMGWAVFRLKEQISLKSC